MKFPYIEYYLRKPENFAPTKRLLCPEQSRGLPGVNCRFAPGKLKVPFFAGKTGLRGHFDECEIYLHSYIPNPPWKEMSTAFDCWMREWGGTLLVTQMLPPMMEWWPMVMRPRMEALE